MSTDTQQQYYDAMATGDYGAMYDMFMEDLDMPGAMSWNNVQLQAYLGEGANPMGGSALFDFLPTNEAYLQNIHNVNRQQRLGREVASAYASATMPVPQERHFNMLRHGTDDAWQEQYDHIQQYATDEARNNPIWGDQARMNISEEYLNEYLGGLQFLANPWMDTNNDGVYDPEESIPSFFQPHQENMYDYEYIWGDAYDTDEWLETYGDLDFSQEDMQNAFYQQMYDEVASSALSGSSNMNMNNTFFDTFMSAVTGASGDLPVNWTDGIEGSYDTIPSGYFYADAEGNDIGSAYFDPDSDFSIWQTYYDQGGSSEWGSFSNWSNETGLQTFNMDDMGPASYAVYYFNGESEFGFGEAPEMTQQEMSNAGVISVMNYGNVEVSNILDEWDLNWDDIAGNSEWWGNSQNQDAINQLTSYWATQSYSPGQYSVDTEWQDAVPPGTYDVNEDGIINVTDMIQLNNEGFYPEHQMDAYDSGYELPEDVDAMLDLLGYDSWEEWISS